MFKIWMEWGKDGLMMMLHFSPKACRKGMFKHKIYMSLLSELINNYICNLLLT